MLFYAGVYFCHFVIEKLQPWGHWSCTELPKTLTCKLPSLEKVILLVQENVFSPCTHFRIRGLSGGEGITANGELGRVLSLVRILFLLYLGPCEEHTTVPPLVTRGASR